MSSYAQRIYNAARRGTPSHKGLPVTLSNLVVAQAKHETDNFTSNAFTQDMNAFGYSYVPNAYWQTDSPGIIADNGEPVGSYYSVEDSTGEIVDWIYRRIADGVFPADLSTINTPYIYAHLLKTANYYKAPESVYANGLRRYYTEMATAGNGVLIALLAGVGVWYYLDTQTIKH